ncbi:MAG: twin-arginine translocation signal domain-containing protein, partial [Gemmatimonadaceae bacterium]
MSDAISRRDLLKALGAAGAAGIIPGAAMGPAGAGTDHATILPPAERGAAVPILPLVSTSEVYIPPRGRGFDKFSFDFPEPSVAFAGLRFGFVVFTRENAYALDPAAMKAELSGDVLTLRCNRFTWAGGQEPAEGLLTARLRRDKGAVTIDVTADMGQPIKTLSTIVRGVPRGYISTGYDFFDPRDDELLFGYPFSGGDLFGPGGAGGLVTPLALVRASDTDVFFLHSLDDQVRTKRFYFQPGPDGYRVEAIFEEDGWRNETKLVVPTWRVGRAPDPGPVIAAHYAHLERAYHLQPFESRPDVPAWLRETALVLTLHGQHYTGYIFNDYAHQLQILRWVATQIDPHRVLAFLSAWDGRYYWDYPLYAASDRMGGDAGFRSLIHEAQGLGFRMMPMFGANAANRKLPMYAQIADGRTAKIDGDHLDLNWVDWDNDRHQEGWLAYMNLGVESWRRWLTGRIAECVERYGVDAYFLDIAGGWVNNPTADMHAGMKQMVEELQG